MAIRHPNCSVRTSCASAAVSLLGATSLLVTSCVPYQQPVGPGGIQNPPQTRYGQRADGGEVPTSGTSGRQINPGQTSGDQVQPYDFTRQNQSNGRSVAEEAMNSVDRDMGMTPAEAPYNGAQPANRETPRLVEAPVENKAPVTPTPPAPVKPPTPVEQYPFAKPVEGRPGTVYSPFAADKQVDVSGIDQGTKVTDPHTGKVFLVP